MSRVGTGIVACLIAGASFSTAAGASLAPVTVDRCSILNAKSYVSGDRPIALSFTVDSPVAVHRIRFTVAYAGRTERVSDSGTFSPGVRIDHRYNGFFDAPYVAAAPVCNVESVEFTDGSTWVPS